MFKVGAVIKTAILILFVLVLPGCMNDLFAKKESPQVQQVKLELETIAWAYGSGCIQANPEDKECMNKGISYAEKVFEEYLKQLETIKGANNAQ